MLEIYGELAATPLEMWVRLTMGEVLALDDVVYSPQAVPDVGEVVFYGVVEAVEWKNTDNGCLRHLARVRICRIQPECFVAPVPGTAVHKAGAAELEAALHFDTMRHKLPLGWLVNGQTAYLNHDFLCGEKGAHDPLPLSSLGHSRPRSGWLNQEGR